MSWMTGTDLMAKIIESAIASGAGARSRASMYMPLIEEWERRGCCWLDGLVGKDQSFDAALARLFPERWGLPEEDDDYDGPACHRGEPPAFPDQEE